MIRNIHRPALYIAMMGMFCSAPAVAADKMTEEINKIFPNMRIDEVSQSPVKGVYEVFTGGNLFYYAAESGHLIFGEMWDKTGRNMTNDLRPKMDKYKESRYASIYKDVTTYFEKAVSVGTGPNIVVEFTDPDCPYCRKMTPFWENRKDVTRYIFFTPLPMHPDAPRKADLILAAKGDKSLILRDVFNGKYDGYLKTTGKYKESSALGEHRMIAAKAGVRGTPAFFINGVFVEGADEAKIMSLLKNSKGVENGTDTK